MEVNPVAFWVISGIAVLASFGVVAAARIMHAALCMGLAFFAVAGLFLLLNAEFLAGAQVLIYVGAVTTIILFGIMLSEVADLSGQPSRQRDGLEDGSTRLRRGVLPLIAGGLFTVLMLTVYSRSEWPGWTPSLLENVTAAIGLELFTTFVIPFELAAVLLLVALVGAIVMATKEESKR